MKLTRYGTTVEATAAVDILRFKSAGFVEVVDDGAQVENPPTADELENKGVDELKEMARMAGFTGFSRMNKRDLIDLLIGEAGDEDGEEDGDD